MQKFECFYGVKKRAAVASNPLSAMKKAFRSGNGWHWEEVRRPRNGMTAHVMRDGEIVLYAAMVDHG